MILERDEPLHQTLLKFLHQHNLENQNAIAVAVSGGPDSMALAGSLIQIYEGDIHIISVDHGLRAQSKDEVKSIEKWVFDLGLDNVNFAGLAWKEDKPENAVMENARRARYDLMFDYCRGAGIDTLFVGHHQNDQAETFLMRLAKGSGLDGLAGMFEYKRNNEMNLARPFLDHPKSDLIEYCHQHEIGFIEDSSNTNNKFMRPRLREAMPALAEEGLTEKRLALTTKRLKRAREALQLISNQAFEGALLLQNDDVTEFNLESLKQYPEEIGLRVLQRAVEYFRPDAAYNVRMEKLEDLFEDLWRDPEGYKARTLGGCKISVKKEKLIVEKEK